MTLGERYEVACAEAARLYAAGQDTTTIDREVDVLLQLLEHPMPEVVARMYDEADLYREVLADEFATPTQKASARRELALIEDGLSAHQA